MPLHSSQLHMVGLLHTPPPMVILRYNRRSSIPIGAPQSRMALRYFIQRSILPFPGRLSSRMGAPQSPPRPRIEAPLFHSRLVATLPFQRCSAWMGSSAGYALLNPCRRSLGWIFTPQFHSVLLEHISTPLAHLELHIRHSSFP